MDELSPGWRMRAITVSPGNNVFAFTDRTIVVSNFSGGPLNRDRKHTRSASVSYVLSGDAVFLESSAGSLIFFILAIIRRNS